MTVSSEYRGFGIARRLVNELSAVAERRGVEDFEIDVLGTNRRAAALFRSLGFTMRFDSGSLVGTRPVRPACRSAAGTAGRGLRPVYSGNSIQPSPSRLGRGGRSGR